MHCDTAGIVYYPNFYTWFDQATETLFGANGLGYAALEADFEVNVMPLVETGAQYTNPCRHGDVLDMASCVDEWSGCSFLVRHRISLTGGQQALEGFERRVMVSPDANSPKGIRAIEIPDAMINRFVD